MVKMYETQKDMATGDIVAVCPATGQHERLTAIQQIGMTAAEVKAYFDAKFDVEPVKPTDSPAKKDPAETTREMFKQLSQDDEVDIHECLCLGLTPEGHLAVMHTNVEDLGDVLKMLELTKVRFLQQFTE